MAKLKYYVFGLGSCVLFADVAISAVPNILPHQGRVTVDGIPFTGSGGFKFLLFTDSDSNHASGNEVAVWSQDSSAPTSTAEPAGQVILLVEIGLYSTGLGGFGQAALPSNLVPPDGSQLFLRVWFNDGVNEFEAMMPDQPVLAVPFARHAAGIAGNLNLGTSSLAAGMISVGSSPNAVTMSASGSGLVINSGLEVGQNLQVLGDFEVENDIRVGAFDSHVSPGLNNTYDLGNNSLRWRSLTLGTGGINLGTPTQQATFNYNTGTQTVTLNRNLSVSGSLSFGSINLPSNVMLEGENISLLNNNANYLSSIAGLKISQLDNDANYLSSIAGLNISLLTNNANYLTSIAGQNISQLNNDSNYLTSISGLNISLLNNNQQYTRQNADNTFTQLNTFNNRVGIGMAPTANTALALTKTSAGGDTYNLVLNSFFGSGDPYYRWALDVGSHDIGSREGDLRLWYDGSGSGVGVFATRGYFERIDGSYNQTSDRRVKTDIEPLGPVLDRVMTVGLRQYRHIDQEPDELKRIGVIAQELKEVFPEFVSGEETENDVMAVNYGGLSTVAIKAIQEQQQMIDAQQKVIADLSVRLERLERQDDEASNTVER